MLWDPFLDQLAASTRSTRRSCPAPCRASPTRSPRSTTCGTSCSSTRNDPRPRPRVRRSSASRSAACSPANWLPTPRAVGSWCCSARSACGSTSIPSANWVATAPERLPALLFHQPDWRRRACDVHAARRSRRRNRRDRGHGLGERVHVEVRVAGARQGVGQADPPHRGSDPGRVGQAGRAVSSVYAAEFGRRIAGSRVEVIDKCGHIPQIEQLDQTLALVSEFLTSSSRYA